MLHVLLVFIRNSDFRTLFIILFAHFCSFYEVKKIPSIANIYLIDFVTHFVICQVFQRFEK